MRTIVISGGNLFEIACAYLGDASQWDRVATLNQLADPWLNGLTKLTIPAGRPATGGSLGAR